MNERLIRWCARRHLRFLKRWHTLEDLVQEGFCVLLRARLLHEPGKGEFSTYLVTALDNHYRRMRDSLHAKGRDAVTLPYEAFPERMYAVDGGIRESDFLLDLRSVRERMPGDVRALIDAILEVHDGRQSEVT